VKAPGAILLIACYELGHQPLAMAWPAAFLEREGFRPALLDLSVESFDPERAGRAQLVAISVPMHTALRLGVMAAGRVRAVNPSCHIVFHGLYAALNADYLLAHGADSVAAGEAEAALVDLARALESGGDRPVRGVTRRGAPARPRLEKLAFCVPSRDRLPPLDRYARIDRGGRLEPAGYVEATRGCRHHCRHCPIPPVYEGRFFVVPAGTVLADIRQQVEAGATHITFGDPDFLNGPGHTLAVARAMHAEFPGLTFDVTAKVEHLLRHRRHLPELGRLGCAFIVSAVESLSDAVLGHLDKGHTRADVLAALRLVREAGIDLRPTWVAFTPWTGLPDYREMLDFLAEEDLVDHVDPVQLSIRLLVPPGSLLARSPAMTPHLGPLVARDFAYSWAHPDPRMDRLHASAAALVAEAAGRGEDPAVTYGRLCRLADEAAGMVPRAPVGLRADRRRPAHLTEPWFC
jgi:radical SAM superfamily enzyme YgiQ (UPF0313 family)